MWIKTEYKGWILRKGRCGWYGENNKREESPVFRTQPELKAWIDAYDMPNRWWEPGAEDAPKVLPKSQWLDIKPADLPFQ